MADPIQTGRVFAYRRVSVAQRHHGGYSLDAQKSAIDGWLRGRGIIDHYSFADDGTSAAMPLGKRPQGQLMVEQAVNRGDTILVTRLDRLFRDVLDFRRQARAWSKLGVTVVSVTETIDLASPAGLFMATLMVAVAELERETTATRQRAHIKARREAGLALPGEPKYGWQHVQAGHKRADGAEEMKVVQSDREQANIQAIISLWTSGKSLREIAREMTRRRILPRHGKKWSHSTIAGIIKEMGDG